MRILQILLFPLHGSGSGSYVDRLAEFEQARGHTVKALCCDHAVPQRGYETAALMFKGDVAFTRVDDRRKRSSGANSIRLPDPTNPDLEFNFPAFTTHPLSTAMTFGSLSDDQRHRYIEAFRRKIHEEVAVFQPDVVHAHHGWVIGAALAELDMPYVISLHGTEHYGFTHYPAYRELALTGLRQADRVLALTAVDRTTAIEAYDLDPDRVVVIASGVDTTAFKPFTLDRASVLAQYGLVEIDRPIVFAGSKLAAFKGTEVLLRAASIYSRMPEHPITLIAGEGSERARVEALRDELQLRDDVVFLGNQSAAQMRDLYNIAEMAVLASHIDWFPLVVLEALACGTPVIASDVGALSQLVDSNIGRLFSAGDYATLAAHVTHFVHTNFKAAARNACVIHVREKFSWDMTVNQIIDVYQVVLAEREKAEGQRDCGTER
jgi:glycosyltransferase involved in cell wall biosynthesis